MFDDFRTDIEERLACGYTVGEVYKELFSDRGGYTMQNFQYFCRTRGLKQKIKWAMRGENCRKCLQCDKCGKIEPYITGHRYLEIRYCKLTDKQINLKVGCPFWCPLGRGEISNDSIKQ